MSDKLPVVRIHEVAGHEGQAVELRGWIYNHRSSGKLRFLQVRDGTGIIQCVVFKGDVTPEVFELTKELHQETSVIVRGEIRADERSPLGYELGVSDVEIVHPPEGEYPISPRFPPTRMETAFRTDTHMARPSITASTMRSMWASERTISAAPRAAGVQFSPTASPTSEARMAGASLAPSPAMATTCPARCRALITLTF